MLKKISKILCFITIFIFSISNVRAAAVAVKPDAAGCLYNSKSACNEACSSGQSCILQNNCWVIQQTPSCSGMYQNPDTCLNNNPNSTCNYCSYNHKYYPVPITTPTSTQYSSTNVCDYAEEVGDKTKKDIWKVTYELNGGEWIDGNTNDRIIYTPSNLSVGDKAVIPSEGENIKQDLHRAYPIKEGKKFKEWQLNGEKFDFSTKPTSDITLVAVYEDLTDDDKRFYCPDSEYSVYEPTEKLCYKVLVPDNDKTYNYTKYYYPENTTFCYSYIPSACSSSQFGVVAHRTGDEYKYETTGKNNESYAGYPYQDAWVSEDSCKLGTSCSTSASASRAACTVKWEAIIYDVKEAELETVFEPDSDINADVTNSVISNIKSGTSFNNVFGKITTKTNKSKIALNNKQSVINNTTMLIKTGDKIKIGTVYYTLSVKGDVTGTGTISMGDVMKIAKLLNNDITEMSLEAREAADVTDDDEIEMNDAMKIAKHIVDNIEL